MSADHRYCILRRPEDPREHPFVFADVQGLARHLHRRRGAAAIQLQDAALEFLDGRKEGVSVFTHQEGMQRRFIGWAYLDGKGFRVLQAALDRQQPQLGRRPTLGRPAQHQPGKAA